MAKQGKCDPCRRIYRWPDDTPLTNAQCPQCKAPLKRCKTSVGRTLQVYQLTNSDVERIPQKRRQRMIGA